MLLDDDCLACIFSFMPLNDLLKTSLINRQWFKVASSDFLWEEHLKQTYMATDWIQYECRARTVFIISQLNSVEHYLVPSDVILDEDSEFRKHVARRKKLISKSLTTRFQINNAFTSQLTLYAIVYVITMVCFILALTLLCIFFPLYLDGIIIMNVNNLNWTILPSVILVIIPFILTIFAICLNVIVLRPRVTKHARLFKDLEITFRGSTVDDSDSFQVAFLSMYGWVFGFPIVVICIYLRFWISSVYNPVNISYQLSMLPLYVFTVLYIVITPICILLQKSDRILKKTLWLIYAAGVIINVVGSVQIELVSAKLDQDVIGFWMELFLPVWITCIIVLLGCMLSPILSCYVWNKQTAKANTIRYTVRAIIGLTTLAIPAMVTLLLVILRADLFGDYFYTYAFFPMYALWAALVGVMLGILCYVCLIPVLDRLI
jgi:hypothetical protein